MPKRTKNALPTPKLVNGTQLAAYFDGKRKTFGNWNSPAAWEKYHAFLRTYVFPKPTPESPTGGVNSENGTLNTPCEVPKIPETPVQPSQTAHSNGGSADGDPTVGDLVAAFLEDALKTKSRSDYGNYKTAGEALYQHSGDLPTSAFDAYLLLQIQDRFCRTGYARTHCNRLVNYIIHMFKWGGVRRLAPAAKYLELKAILPVPYGKAKENPIRRDVALEVVVRTLAFLFPVYQAIVWILLWTGARPSEIYRMKVGDIDQTNPESWVYRPRFHKTTRHNQKRIITFGAKEQAVLAPYMAGKSPNSAVFSPHDAVSERKQRDRKNRKTPIPPSQAERERLRRQNPKKRLNEHFTDSGVSAYLRKAIAAANAKLPPDAQIPAWTMYQLRHHFATQAMMKLGEMETALLLGHSDPKMIRERYDHSHAARLSEYKKRMESEN